MSYYFSKTIDDTFDNAVVRTTAALKCNGFGILTEIDVAATMKAKLNIEFRPYRIFGACNPPLAHQALIAEDKIGTMLPCNVIVQQLTKAKVEIAAINPLEAMANVGNPALSQIAKTVAAKLQQVMTAI